MTVPRNLLREKGGQITEVSRRSYQGVSPPLAMPRVAFSPALRAIQALFSRSCPLSSLCGIPRPSSGESLEERKVDSLLLFVERRVGITREDGEEKPGE